MSEWIILCIGSLISYMIFECIVIYSRSIYDVCNHPAPNDTLYISIEYMCLGGFLVLFVNLCLKLMFIEFDSRYVPLYISFTILLFSTLTAAFQIVLDNTYCLDMLHVASNPYMWGEWISCSPLLIYSTCIITAESLTREDIAIAISYTLSVFFGFILLIPQPKGLAQFILLISVLTFMPTFYLPYCKPNLKIHPLTNSDMSMEVQEQFFKHKLKIRKKLAIVLCVILPVFPLVYLLGLFESISHEATVTAFNVLSLVTKGVYIEICTGSYIYMITKIEDILIEEQHANRARREFVKYIFHEVRTPFNSISIAVDLLEECKHLKDTEKDYLKMMREACTNISETLDSVLTMQKIEEGQLDLTYGNYDIRQIFHKVFNVLKGLIMQKRIDIEFCFSTNTPNTVYIDGIRLEHVIINLLGNAIKFTPHKGRIAVNVLFEYGTFMTNAFTPGLTLQRPNKKQYLKLSKQLLALLPRDTSTEQMLLMKVSITDNGPGISPEDTKKLFKPFSQINPGKMQAGKGSGLGLSFCKTIVELHGGEIGVHSVLGSGTTFKFVIPIRKFQDTEQEKSLHSKSVSRKKPESTKQNKMVLIADDSFTNRKLLKQLLLLYDMPSKEVENGQEALTEIQNYPDQYKVVFMDNFMPVMDGITAAKQMRKCQYNNIIIGLTGNTLQEDKDMFMEAGVNYVFTKPISKATVKAIVDFMNTKACAIGDTPLQEHEDGLSVAWIIPSEYS